MTVRAFDPRGAFVLRTFALSTQPDTTPPVVTVSITPRRVGIGQPVTIVISTIEPTADPTTQVTLTHNGVPTPLVPDQFGRIVYTPGALGQYVIEVVVTDGSGNVGRAIDAFSVPDPNDVTPPVVAIATPVEDEVVLMQTAITGTASDDNLLSYTVYLKRNDDEQWFQIGAGTQNVFGGQIGTVDGTLLVNGLYTLRVSATDINGQMRFDERPIEIDGGAKIGIFTVSFNDLTIPVAGIPITVTRTYDSRVKVKKDFGVGWELSVAAGKFTTNRKLGDGWRMEKKVGFGQPLCGQISEPKKHRVEVRLSDREVFRFQPQILNPSGGFGFCEGELAFFDSGGVRPGAKLELIGQRFVFQQSGESLLRDPDSLALFDPQNVRLTTPEGYVFDVSKRKGITSIQDRNDNVITISPSGIASSVGLGIVFQRDALGRITRITDPLSRGMSYRYDGNGDLVTFTDVLQNETTFRYLASPAHHLEEIINALGQRGIRNEYDASGRLVATIDARGRRIEMEHDLASQHEVVRNRLGHPTEFAYDVRGNVTLERKYVTVNGPIVAVDTVRTYDAEDNELTVRDPLGHVTAKTYDANSNVLSVTVAQGTPDEMTTTYTYGPFNQVASTTDAKGALRRTVYDVNGNALFEKDALGRTSTSTYDARGNLVRRDDSLGYATRFGYDSLSRMVSQTDALGVVTTYAYDAAGNQLGEVVYRTDEFGASVKVERTREYDALNRVVRDVDALGHASRTEYDALGRVSARVDRRGFRTETQYDDLGQMVGTRHADRTSESYTYDAEGRTLTTTDRGGRVTRYEYDELGRPVRTVNADLTTRSAVYDVAGNAVAELDERGNRTEYHYDAQVRRVLTRNALGEELAVSFDAAGNRETMTDGRGNVTTFEYDLNRRQTATVFADGYRTRTVYDRGGRVIERIDQRNISTQYEYDGIGRLVAVLDALGRRTSYGYDQVGNRVSQTDANNHTTRFGFDSEGRMVSRTLPLGQHESLEYDEDGSQTAKVTFNGDRLEYDFDSNRRMIRKRVPGPSEYLLTYTPNGQRESVLDYRGLTTYEYDSRDKLTRVDYPEGTFVSYTWDAAGNRASVTSSSQTVGYTYDAANRMQQVIEPGGVFAFEYDSAGNQIGLTYPNGVVETRTYDAVNRLLTIDAVGPLGVVTSFHYSLDGTGRRRSAAEHDSRQVVWEYDDSYRLTAETVIDPVNGDYHHEYVYDAVGNRLAKVEEGGTISHTYDANDRMMTTSGATHEWDENGQQVGQRGPREVDYMWSPEGILAEAYRPSAPPVLFGYDVDGYRVSKSVDGIESVLVNDHTSAFVYPIEDRADSRVRSFTIAAARVLSQRGDAASEYLFPDASGSVRVVLGGTSRLASYVYEAFGGSSVGRSEDLYRFAGEPYDPEIGTTYLRARYLDRESGRFLSRDPEESALSDPAEGNAYTYARNSPVTHVDPLGTQSLPSGPAFSPPVSGTCFGCQDASGFAIAGQRQTVISYAFVPNNAIPASWSAVVKSEVRSALHDVYRAVGYIVQENAPSPDISLSFVGGARPEAPEVFGGLIRCRFGLTVPPYSSVYVGKIRGCVRAVFPATSHATKVNYIAGAAAITGVHEVAHHLIGGDQSHLDDPINILASGDVLLRAPIVTAGWEVGVLRSKGFLTPLVSPGVDDAATIRRKSTFAELKVGP